jgi:hypothetical protein
MKNVKVISIVGMLLVTTAANAQFTAGNDFAHRRLSWLGLHVTKVTPPDHSRDPEYKVNLRGAVDHRSDPPSITEFEATHTTMSGRKYSRSAQYTNASLRFKYQLDGGQVRLIEVDWWITTTMAVGDACHCDRERGPLSGGFTHGSIRALGA